MPLVFAVFKGYDAWAVLSSSSETLLGVSDLVPKAHLLLISTGCKLLQDTVVAKAKRKKKTTASLFYSNIQMTCGIF